METRILAKYVVDLNFKSIPKQITEYCKSVILDTVGCAVGGSMSKSTRIALNFAREFGDNRDSSIIVYGDKTSCLNAAFVNGVMSHSLSFDDVYTGASVHAACAIIPAALAVAEREDTSGSDLITAVVVGYDVGARVSRSVYPSSYEHGFWNSGICNNFAATAAAGKILDLNEDQLTRSLGLAGMQAAGLRQYQVDGNILWDSSFQAGGRPAQNGIFAALLAQKGYQATPSILEGKWGFCKVFADHHSLSKLTDKLGQRFEVAETSLKPYPACTSVIPAIDASIRLTQNHKLEHEEIERVRVRTTDFSASFCNNPISHGFEPRLSLQYCVAAALIEGDFSLESLVPDKVASQKILKLARKTEVISDLELNAVKAESLHRKRPTVVEVIMKNGETYSCRVDYVHGTVDNPLTYKELTRKFRKLSSGIIKDNKVAELIKKIRRLERMNNIKDLMELLVS